MAQQIGRSLVAFFVRNVIRSLGPQIDSAWCVDGGRSEAMGVPIRVAARRLGAA
jgi:hypothetical protein